LVTLPDALSSEYEVAQIYKEGRQMSHLEANKDLDLRLALSGRDPELYPGFKRKDDTPS
jgi:hypothetical protein